MTARLRPYSSYRSSCLSWIEEVPAHWQIKRNGQLFWQRKETGFAALPILEVSLHTGVRVRRFDGTARKQVMSDRSKYKRAAKGDVAYNMMRMWQGAVGVAPEDGLVSPAYVAASPYAGVESKYFSELFRTVAYMGEVDTHSHGIVKDRNRLYWEDFKQIYSVCPPRDEQAAIIRYVEHIDRRVRQLLHGKQRLLATLEEQRRAIVHRAVSQGFDRSVRMRDSGVQWLGQIPEHWHPYRLKYLITPIEQGWSPQCDAQPASENEWGVLKVGCVNREYFDPSQNKKLPSTLSPVPELEIRSGDILMSRANTRGLLGLAVVVTDTRPLLLLCDKLFRFRTLEQRSYGPFIVAAIRDKNSRVQIEASTNGASDSMQNIGQGVVKNLWLAVPPVDEQRLIVGRFTSETASIDLAIAQERRGLALLREYRTRLVTDVVTGQLDVREAAANLPDEPDEPNKPSLTDEILEEADEADLDVDELVGEVAE